MKIVRTGDEFVFHASSREKNLLQGVLKLYPLIPSAHHLKKAGQLPESSRKLLDEALADQRAESKKQLEAFLTDMRRFVQTEEGWRFSLSTAELEWLLQVLNDIRVGSWINLGAPEEKLDVGWIDKEIAPHFWTMEIAGAFQMEMLAALKE